MKQIAAFVCALAVAFGAGFAVAHLSSPASAAAVALTPQVLDLAAMTYADLPSATPTTPVHAKGLVSQDGMTLGIQMGPTPKHFHADANEVQYVVDGTGTQWLGDKQVALKPGTLLIIPKGTTHGGILETGAGHVKIIAIKTPPQAPDDTHIVP